MKSVIQRVSRSSVSVDGKKVAEIGLGLLVLVGFHKDDQEAQLSKLLDKLVKLRIFEDPAGKMNLSVADVGGSLLLVPQFTLYGDVSGGNRPSFGEAAAPERGRKLFEKLCALARQKNLPAKFGVFQAMMQVELVNDGPVTIIADLERREEERVRSLDG